MNFFRFWTKIFFRWLSF